MRKTSPQRANTVFTSCCLYLPQVLENADECGVDTLSYVSGNAPCPLEIFSLNPVAFTKRAEEFQLRESGERTMKYGNTSEIKRGIDLKPGVFVLRYAIAEEVSAHPAIKVSIDAASTKDVFLVLHHADEAREVTLWQPGAGVALKAVRPGRIMVEVIPIQADASTNATIKIDSLIQGENSYQYLGQAAGHAKQELNLSGLKLHGHVASRGDIEVSANEWLAGPAIPARIEGIAIEWPNKPRNIDLRYCAIGPKSNAATTPMIGLGGFTGTRGRALPIFGLNLELIGPGVTSMQLVAEALFLGTPVMRIAGTRVTLSGPSGLEPLIGLKLSVEAKQQEASQDAPAPETVSSNSAARPVRVFRGKARSSTG